MSFRFRFPLAVLHYLKSSDKKDHHSGIERAREWAVPSEGERRKRPSLTETDAWIREIQEADNRKEIGYLS